MSLNRACTELADWVALWRELGARGDPAPWHARLVSAYAEPPRHYHNRQHLEECLAELARHRGLAARPALVATAGWFHDAVYDPRSATNEEDSAALAVACLEPAGVAALDIAAVRALILCTKTHETAGVVDAALLIDADLAILGQGSERFWQYETAIRNEYAWVPEAAFREKRAEILARFLTRPFLYQTPAFRARYEAMARANLTAAIARLAGGKHA